MPCDANLRRFHQRSEKVVFLQLVGCCVHSVRENHSNRNRLSRLDGGRTLNRILRNGFEIQMSGESNQAIGTVRMIREWLVIPFERVVIPCLKNGTQGL